MRRRQVWAALRDAEITNTVMAQAFQQASVKQETKKGYCSKCGKKIGRGIRFHEKACKG